MIVKERHIDRICLIDDTDDARSVMADTLLDSQFVPVPQNENVKDLKQFLNTVQNHDAIVTDHHLKKKNYFPVNGAEVVAECYSRHIPSLLVTKYRSYVSEIRKFRQWIPVILNPDDFEISTLIRGLEICIDEFNGIIMPQRKIWQTLIRVDSIDENYFNFIIPSWDANEIISLNLNEVPQDILSKATPDSRFFVDSNVGAESPDDLFFIKWKQK